MAKVTKDVKIGKLLPLVSTSTLVSVILFALALIAPTVNASYKYKITIGVVVKSDSPAYIRTSMEKAIASINYPGARVRLRELTINNETTVSEMCSALLGHISQLNTTTKVQDMTHNQLIDPARGIVTDGEDDDEEANPKITFLLDASDVQLGFLANGSTDDEQSEDKSKPSIDFSHRFGIPTLATISSSWGKNIHVPSSDREWLVTVKTIGHVITTSMVKDLMLEYGIRKVAILYDESFASSHPESLSTLSSVFLDDIVIFQIFGPNLERIGSVIENVEKYNVTSYVVLATMETINAVLDVASDKKLLSGQNTFYFITKSRGKVKCRKCTTSITKSSSVLLIQPMKESDLSYNHSAPLSTTVDTKVDSYFYYDLTRSITHSVYDLMKRGSWPNFNRPKCHESLSDDERTARGDLIQLASEMSIDGLYGKFGRFVFDSAVESGNTNFQDVRFKVIRVDFKLGQDDLTIEKIAEWIYNGEYNGRFMYPNYWKEFDFNYTRSTAVVTSGYVSATPTKDKQDTMRVVMYLQQPFIMKRIIDTRVAPPRVEYYGYCIDLLNMIRAKMANDTKENKHGVWKWNYELYEVPDGRFGEKLPDGEWTGIIGEIHKKKADIGLGPIAVMAERETVVDFTVPYYDLVGISILMKRPAVASHLFKFLTVLESSVWFSILGSLIIVAGILWAYDRLSPFSYYNNKAGWADQKRRDFSYKESLWFCMTSLTPQGGGEGPQNVSGRIAAATWWAFGFIVIAAYTANLAAFLTVSRLDSNIESLEHLSYQYRIRYATQVDTEALVYFKRMAYIEHKFYQIWKNMSLNPMTPPEERAAYAVWDYPISDKYTKILAQMYQAGMPRSYEEGVRRTRASKSAQEGFGFIADAVQVKFAISTHCDLYSIGNEFSRKPIALVIQQNTTLKDALSSAILKLLNERKLETLKENWWSHYKRICEDIKKSSDGISIHNIGGVFIVIFAGVLLAIITLIFEYIFLRAKRNSIRQAAEYHRMYGNMKNGMIPGAISRGYKPIPNFSK